MNHSMSPSRVSDPWQEMRRLQRDMERFFGGLGQTAQWSLTGEYPPLNIHRDDQGITLDALCPGVDRQSLDLTVVGDAVTIKAERKPEPNLADDRYYRRERPAGTFARTVSLGERLDPDRTQATYANGILRLRLGRAPEATPKKIQIAS